VASFKTKLNGCYQNVGHQYDTVFKGVRSSLLAISGVEIGERPLMTNYEVDVSLEMPKVRKGVSW